jgi:E3 ubiquitin-protein ligase UHRF1
MPSAYELDRQRNIERNQKILADLGLDKPFFEPKEKRRPPKSVQKKRKASTDQNDNDAAPPVKVTRITSSEELATGVRRSQRNAGKTIDYKGEQEPASQKALTRTRSLPENAGELGRSRGKRLHNPCVHQMRVSLARICIIF